MNEASSCTPKTASTLILSNVSSARTRLPRKGHPARPRLAKGTGSPPRQGQELARSRLSLELGRPERSHHLGTLVIYRACRQLKNWQHAEAVCSRLAREQPNLDVKLQVTGAAPWMNFFLAKGHHRLGNADKVLANFSTRLDCPRISAKMSGRCSSRCLAKQPWSWGWIMTRERNSFQWSAAWSQKRRVLFEISGGGGCYAAFESRDATMFKALYDQLLHLDD